MLILGRICKVEIFIMSQPPSTNDFRLERPFFASVEAQEITYPFNKEDSEITDSAKASN